MSVIKSYLYGTSLKLICEMFVTNIRLLLVHFVALSLAMKSSKPIDFYRLVSLNLESLKLMGLWFYIPHPVSSVQFWLQVWIRILSGVLVFFIPPLAQIAYFLKLVSSKNFQIQEASSSINLIFTELLISLKLLDMFTRRARLATLTDSLVNGEFYRDGVHRNVLEHSIKLSRRLFCFFLIGTSLNNFAHMVVAPVLNGFSSLPVKMDLIFIDVNDPAYFTYVCVYQILYKPILVVSYVALQTLTWAYLLFGITQLDILIYNFKNMKELVKEIKVERNCSENDAFEEIFTRCVLHHRAIISFFENAGTAFEGQFMLTLMLNGCIICTTGVQFLAISTKDVIGVLWVLAYMQIIILFLFCDCYFGNAVFVKSIEVATVAFECPWLTVSPKLKKNLTVFIARAQKPLVITAYNIVPVSLPTFTKVMNWTYKAFAVMNEMKK